MSNPFEILGLETTATEQEIDRRRRHLMLQVHPDKSTGNEAQTRIYNEAHEQATRVARESRLMQTQHKKELFQRMINVILDKRRRLNADESEFSPTPNNWTPEQKQEAEDAVLYGISDARKRMKMAEQENIVLREQIVALQATINQERHRANTAEAKLPELLKEKHTLHEQLLELRQEQITSGCKFQELQASNTELLSQLHAIQETTHETKSEPPKRARTAETNCQKRRHVKHFETQETELAFKTTITSLLQTRFQANEHAFVSTKKIHSLFTEHNGQMPNDQFFCKNLRKQMRNVFPVATLCEKRFSGVRVRGYLGIELI